jgi:LysM repeat protein
MARPIAHVALPEASSRLPLPKAPKGPPPRTPGPHLVNFFALDASVSLTVRMGHGPATLTGGSGGWIEETRRGLSPVVWWDSPSAYRQSIPVLFEGSEEQEGSIQALQLLAGPDRKHPRTPPPIIMIAGPAIWRADLQWVIEAIEPGSNVVRRADDGKVMKQDYVVKLLEYNGVDVLIERSPSRKASSESSNRPSQSRRTYRVKAGDTLPNIAARPDVYGDSTKWKRIANANGIRDPRTLKVGQVLKIPR